MLGNPKFKRGDKVKFYINNQLVIGQVYIVDAYGTFEQDREVSYDIMVLASALNNTPTLFKHIIETALEPLNS